MLMEGESLSLRLLQRVVDKKNALCLFLSNVFQNHFIFFSNDAMTSRCTINTPVSNLGSPRLTSRPEMNYGYIAVIVIPSRLIIG
jgi:hypothetical protein